MAHLGTYGVADLDGGTPMREDTIFRIYSMTKAVGSAGVMVLVEEGQIDLDAPLSSYLTELADMQVVVDPAADAASLRFEPAAREMTVRDALRHTSGLPGTSRYLASKSALGDLYRESGMDRLFEHDLKEIVQILGTVPLLYHPGARWQYSISADVLGRLIEVVAGVPFDQFLEERIFQPLGMVDTGFFVPPEQRHRLAALHGPGEDGRLRTILAPQGGSTYEHAGNFLVKPRFLSNGGGLVSTAADYLRFCLMLTGGGRLGEVRLLQPETVAEMTRNQLPDSLIPIDKAPAERYDGLGFGLGVSVRAYQTDWVPAAQVGSTAGSAAPAPSSGSRRRRIWSRWCSYSAFRSPGSAGRSNPTSTRRSSASQPWRREPAPRHSSRSQIATSQYRSKLSTNLVGGTDLPKSKLRQQVQRRLVGECNQAVGPVCQGLCL